MIDSSFRENGSFTRIFVLFFVLYVLARLLAFRVDSSVAQHFNDSAEYFAIADAPLTGDFFVRERPFVVPMIYKLLGKGDLTIVWFQFIFSVMAWTILAWRFSNLLISMIAKISGVLIVLLFSLTENVIGWDRNLLSESLSISLLALVLSASLDLLGKWTSKKALLFLVFTFLWAFTRVTNAFVIGALGGILFIISLAYKSFRKRLFLMAIPLFMFFILSQIASNVGQYWLLPIQNVFVHRILMDVQGEDFLIRCGLPMTPELGSFRGQLGYSQDWALYKDPVFSEYREWLHHKGRSCYLKYLLSRPLSTMSEPVSHAGEIVGSDVSKKLYVRNMIPYRLQKVLYPKSHRIVTVLELVLVFLTIIPILKAWNYNPAWLLIFLGLILTYPHVFMIYHADADEFDRHGVILTIQVYLVLWMAGIMVLDWCVLIFSTLLALIEKRKRSVNRDEG